MRKSNLTGGTSCHVIFARGRVFTRHKQITPVSAAENLFRLGRFTTRLSCLMIQKTQPTPPIAFVTTSTATHPGTSRATSIVFTTWGEFLELNHLLKHTMHFWRTCQLWIFAIAANQPEQSAGNSRKSCRDEYCIIQI